jgi:penicillin-binding protein 1A
LRAYNALKRNDIAGKTGTTNDYGDAWFCGYNPEIVAVAWIGFPIPRNRGSGETGGTAALPIWINYKRPVLAKLPETELPRPDGIASAPVDDGSREDYYYAEHKPPELREPELEEDLLKDLMNPPANAQDHVPAVPIQTHPLVDDSTLGEQGY